MRQRDRHGFRKFAPETKTLNYGKKFLRDINGGSFHSSRMKLFVVYVGGEVEQSHVELHDVRFCIGARIEDCYDDLRAQWWGTPESLHLDCWGVLNYADGYDITLSPTPPDEENDRLYFVNLGGYTDKLFTELHENIFVVATTESKAKVKALKTIQQWKSPHRDYQYDIEKAVCLNDKLAGHGYHIHLTRSDRQKEFQFTCRYTPLKK